MDDQILDLILNFYCSPANYRLETADGMFVGLRLAYDSAIAGKEFSRELKLYLFSKKFCHTTVSELKREISAIETVIIKDGSFLCDFVGPESQMLPDFTNGMWLSYELAMNAFIKIRDYYRGTLANETIEIYRDMIQSLLEDLRDREILISKNK